MTTKKKPKKEEVFNPGSIMEGIVKELDSVLKSMEQSKTPEDKLIHSKTIKNLCDSLGVFLDLIESINPFDDEGDMPF